MLTFYDEVAISKFFEMHPNVDIVAFSTNNTDAGTRFHIVVKDFPAPKSPDHLISVQGSYILRGEK